jgi:hypothetical protein
MAFSGQDLTGKMQVAIRGFDIFMAHDVHQPVDIHPARLLHLIHAVVRGKVMPELMGGEVKGERRGRFPDHQLDRIPGKMKAGRTDKQEGQLIQRERAQAEILTDKKTGSGPHRDNPVFLRPKFLYKFT